MLFKKGMMAIFGLLCLLQLNVQAQNLSLDEGISKKHWKKIPAAAQELMESNAQELLDLCVEYPLVTAAMLPMVREEQAGRQGNDMEFSAEEQTALLELKANASDLEAFMLAFQEQMGNYPQVMQPHISDLLTVGQKIYSQEAQVVGDLPLYLMMHGLHYQLLESDADEAPLASFLVGKTLEKMLPENAVTGDDE